MKKVFKFIAFFLTLILISIITLLISYFLITKNSKLDLAKLSSNDFVIEVYSSNDVKIAEKSAKNGNEFVKLSELNDYTKNAFIAIEDRRFYSHNGIDYKRIAGALLENVKSLSFKEGASTITQQLVKNTHLTQEKTLKRKFSEIKIAMELEKRYSKDQILESYLNTIYFGKGAYGIESASNRYFNKSASELTLNESAMLAGIIKSPSKYSPIENYENAVNRKNLVLKCMVECDFISESEYESLKNQTLKVCKNAENPLDDYVNACINEYENLSIFEPYSNEKIKIYTYLDENLQRDIFEKTSENYSTSKIVINSKINGVIAFYGNNSNLKRNPASCVKPWLIYAPMINDGYIKESSVIIDEPINYNGYSPKNYDNRYNGKVTVKTALSKSLNVPAVKLLNGYGLENVNLYTKKMGLDVKNESLSCALGSINGGLTLKELCDNYSSLNSNGKFTKSSFIKKIVIGNVNAYYHKPYSVEVFTPETAYIVSDMLRDAVNNGNSKKLRSLPYEICAKTGTNGTEKGNYDALSVSYTSDSIVGVWVGNEDNSIMSNDITGSGIPSIKTREIYEKLYKNHTPKPLEAPNNVERVEIDKDYLLSENIELIKDGGEPFYYLKENAPKIQYKSVVKPQITNLNITLNNNLVTLSYNAKNVDFIEINKIFKDKTTTIYNGTPTNTFLDALNSYGLYEYQIVINTDNGKIVYNFNKVNYKKSNSKILKDDNWVYE